jgi:hypothetical protein
MATHRVSRGRISQVWVAELVAARLGFDATSNPASLPGKDILNTPGLSIEVKATGEFDMLAALRQAAANAEPEDLPIAVYRPRGYGQEKLGQWPMFMRLEDGLDLLRRAGWYQA